MFITKLCPQFTAELEFYNSEGVILYITTTMPPEYSLGIFEGKFFY